MKPIKERISHWQLLSLAKTKRTSGPLSDIVLTVAFLFLLRWADGVEKSWTSETKNEREIGPILPPSCRWSEIRRNYSDLLFSAVEHRRFVKKMIQDLRDVDNTAALRCVQLAAQSFNWQEFHPKLFFYSLSYVDGFKFVSDEDRRNAGKAFGALVGEALGSTAYGGEMVTTRQIAELMAGLADPRPGEHIYDPCFGLAELLLSARDHIGKIKKGDSLRPANCLGSTIHGIEIERRQFLVGLAKLVLAGEGSPHVEIADALNAPAPVHGRYDVVLAAPPFGRRVDEQYADASGSGPVFIENLFVRHATASLAPGGRAAVLLNDGFLFRGGNDRKLRKSLLSDLFVDAVLTLPPGVMQPYTQQPLHVVLFHAGEPTSEVWFREVQATHKADGKNPSIFDVAHELQLFRERAGRPHARKATIGELAERGYEFGTVKHAPEMEEFLKAVDDLEFGTVRIAALKDIAEIRNGISYNRDDVTIKKTSRSPAVVRASEIRVNGTLKRPKLFLTSAAAQKLRKRSTQSANAFLREDDLLLTTRGIPGKTICVESGLNAIPGSGVTIVRVTDERIDHKYLQKLLRSRAYQGWILTNARGLTRNISSRSIGQMPVPILSREMQSRFASEIDDLRAADLIPEEIPPVETISKPIHRLFVPALDLLGQWAEAPHGQPEKLEAFAAKLSEIVSFYSEPECDPAAALVLTNLLSLTGRVSSAMKFGTDASRVLLVERLKREAEAFSGRNDLSKQNTELSEFSASGSDMLSKGIALEMELIFGAVRLDANLDPPIIAPDEKAHISLIVTNRGLLPLQDLDFMVVPGESGRQTEILKPDETFSWSIPVEAEDEGTFSVDLHWKAVRLDGKMVDGRIDLGYRVSKENELMEDEIFRENPYIVGQPIDEGKTKGMFYGREDLLEEIRRSLRKRGPSTVILLEGNRRIGKTSILIRLQEPDVLPGWIPVYFTLQGGGGDEKELGLPAEEIYYNIAREIILAVHARGFSFDALDLGRVSPEISARDLIRSFAPALRPAFTPGNSFEVLNILIGGLAEMLKDERIVLLLDEFDKIQTGIENKVTNPNVIDNLRDLFRKYVHLSCIISGSRGIKRLRENKFNSLFGIGIVKSVDSLDEDSARKLVTDPVAQRLVYSDDARNAVLASTRSQPFLIQALCYRIFEECYSPPRSRNVTIATVNSAVDKMVADNEHFHTIFDDLQNDRRRYLSCLVNNLSKGPDRVTFDLIKDSLDSDAIEYSNRDLTADIRYLQELDLLVYSNESYGIKIPLFSKWLDSEDAGMYRRLAMEE